MPTNERNNFVRIYSDLPASKDQPGGLGFGFMPMARTLAELARNPLNETPFTVVVKGKWGKGKTTLLQETKRQLDDHEISPARQTNTLWFNAWKYPDSDTVLVGLLGSLVSEIRKGGIGEQLKLLINNAKYSWAGSFLGAIAPNSEVGNTRYDRVFENRALYDGFRSLFAELIYVWHSNTGAFQDTQNRDLESRIRELSETHTLAIFIDDLDRCSEHRVKNMLEAISLFADLPGVCFYLALDWERVVEILSEGGMKQDKAEQFLEKIVQIAIDLPVINEGGIRDYMSTLSEGFFDGYPGQIDRESIRESLVEALSSSPEPRHIKRVFNDLSLTLGLLKNSQLLTGPNRLPLEAVVCWHILRETMSAGEWNLLRESPMNVKDFQTQWRGLNGTESEEISVFNSVSFRVLLNSFVNLTDEQIEDLVFYGSPRRSDEGTLQSIEQRTTGFDIRSFENQLIRLNKSEFLMGADHLRFTKPEHTVTLSAFRMSKHPITNEQFYAFVQETGASGPSHWINGVYDPKKADHPVVNVTWHDAVRFCEWMTLQLEREGFPGVCSLPTEAQWELCAKGESNRLYPWGKTPPTPRHANFGDVSLGTTPIGHYPVGATDLGFHDLAGNVWEWCFDWYASYTATKKVDPRGPTSGELKTSRGGSYGTWAVDMHSAARRGLNPDEATDFVGFRVVHQDKR